MIKRFVGLFFLAIFIYGCSDKPKVDKNLIYSILNDIIQQDSIFARIVCSKFDQVTIPEDIQKEFFNSDRKFIQEQLKNSSHAVVDTGKLYFYSRH